MKTQWGRFALVAPQELLQRLRDDAKRCGCGSVSAHLRHVLKEHLDKEA